MAYTTADKVRDIAKGVTTARMDDTEMERHIARADSYIDASVSSLYSVPFATIPSIIEWCSTLLSAYYVMFVMFTRDGVNINEWVTNLQKEAYKILEEIASGKTILLDASGNQIARKSDVNYSTTSEFSTIFDVDDIENQGLSSEREDDISDQRD